MLFWNKGFARERVAILVGIFVVILVISYGSLSFLKKLIFRRNGINRITKDNLLVKSFREDYFAHLNNPGRDCRLIESADKHDCEATEIYNDVPGAKAERCEWSRNLAFTLENAYNNFQKLSGVEGRTDAKVKDGHDRFDLLGPTGPTCKNIESFGEKDQEKRACGLKSKSRKNKNCVIFSIGSNNEWGFEESIFDTTDCFVHVFDCTVPQEVEPPARIQSRVKLYKTCIGDKDLVTEDSKRWQFRTWESLLNITGMTSAPTFLKMDVEGWEYAVLKEIVNSGVHLPLQIALELHYDSMARLGLPWGGKRFKSPGEIAVFMDFLFRYGNYHLIDRNDNPYCQHCTEILLSRFCPSS